MRTKLHENILETLKKLSFTSSGREQDSWQQKPISSGNPRNVAGWEQANVGGRGGADFHFSNSGRLVAGRQLVYLIDIHLGKDPVITYIILPSYWIFD